MFCTKCAAQINDSTQYCGTCGAKQPTNSIPPLKKPDSATRLDVLTILVIGIAITLLLTSLFFPVLRLQTLEQTYNVGFLTENPEVESIVTDLYENESVESEITSVLRAFFVAIIVTLVCLVLFWFARKYMFSAITALGCLVSTISGIMMTGNTWNYGAVIDSQQIKNTSQITTAGIIVIISACLLFLISCYRYYKDK